MGKTVKGFGVRGQDRRKTRDDLSGEYEGHDWFVRSEHSDLFMWNIGEMSGYSGPTLGHVLRVMKKAAKAQDQLKDLYEGERLPKESLNALRLLNRWEQRVVSSRLTITGPHGKGAAAHFRVFEHTYS